MRSCPPWSATVSEKTTLPAFLRAQRESVSARHAGHLDVVRELLDGRTGTPR